MAHSQCGDDSFGPTVSYNCREGFDFTLYFEQAVLGIAPASVFVVASVFRLLYLAKKKAAILPSRARVQKLVAALCFFGLQLALMVVWSTAGQGKTSISTALASLNVVVALQVILLTWFEDVRSIRPSSLLSIYLLLTFLLDITQLRTLWLKHETLISALLSASTALKGVIVILESRSKTPHIKGPPICLPPESTSGIVNRSVLWWINDMFSQGFNTALSLDNLYTLTPELTSATLGERVQKEWDSRKRPESRFEFVWVIIKVLRWQLLSVAVPRLCRIGFSFAQPFLIYRAVSLLLQPDGEMTKNEGYGLIGATALVYLGLAISNLHYEMKNTQFLTMLRGAAVTLIYNQALLCQGDAQDASAAVTLMGTDVARIAATIRNLNECWARLIEVVIAVTLLAMQLGWVCIIPVLVVVVCFFGSGRVSKSISGRQKEWVDAVQKRITMTSGMLADMGTIKTMGLSGFFASAIQQQRIEETNRMADYRWSIVWQNIVSNVPSTLGTSLTFTIFAIWASLHGNESLGTTRAFTSLSLISLLNTPAADLLGAVPSTVSSLGCFGRIQNFLTLPPRKDSRILMTPGPSSPPSSRVALEGEGDISLMPLKSVSHGFGDPHSHATIVVQGLDVRMSPDTDLVLRQVSFSVSHKTLTMIIGPVGSGKSILLRALLGEVDFAKGSVTVSTRRVAVCTQRPWLPNTTIRMAILGPHHTEKLDEPWYQATLRACSLDHDLALLPNRDLTVIGNGGTTLSGGQQQRVALARALYSRADLFILDDVFSALDPTTQRTVFERLLGVDGLLKKLNSTIVLVTHAVEYLSYADSILVLSEGTIKRQGSYEAAVQQGWVDAAKELTVHGKNDSIKNSDATNRILKTANENAGANELTDLKRAAGDVALYRYYYGFIGWPKMVMFVFFVAVNTFGVYFGDVWLRWWSDIDGTQIPLYATVYLSLSVIAAIGMGVYIWTIVIVISPSTARKSHQVLLNTVMRAPQSFFSKTDTGSILNRFSQDMTLIESSLPTGVLLAVSNLFYCIASVALVVTGSTYMVASVPLVALVIGLLQYVYLRTSRQLRLLDIEANSPLYTHFLETLTGLTTIRAFGWQESCRDKNHSLLDLSQRPYYLFQCIQNWLTLVLYLITGGLAVLVVGLATGLRSTSEAGLLGLSLNNILVFNSNVSSFVTGWIMLETSLGSLARLKSFSETVKSEDKEDEKQVPCSTWPEKGSIEIRNVSASHDPSARALHNISLHVKPGQKVGICGRTGSGKSSLLGTLLRLLEIDSGTILIDDIDLSTVPRETIRSRLVAIPQRPLIISGTARVNVDPKGLHSDTDMVAALERVGLSSWLAERGGLDANLTMDSMSQGQQQLLALARASLRSGSVLLLDEATSNMDTETDGIIQRVVRERFASWTVVTVAHRLNTIMASDVIVVMDGGRIVEVGEPNELLQKGGRFADLIGT